MLATNPKRQAWSKYQVKGSMWGTSAATISKSSSYMSKPLTRDLQICEGIKLVRFIGNLEEQQV